MEERKVNYSLVFKKILERKRLYAKTVIPAFIISILWIFPQPRTYETEVSLAPEMGNSLGGDAISSLASTFGFDLGNLQNNDAIYPTLYPEVLKSTSFVISLFDVKVTTEDGLLTTSYYDYLLKHTESNPYLKPFYLVIKWVTSLVSNDSKQVNVQKVNAFKLTKDQDKIVKAITSSISCNVDKKTDVITITVIDQDPYICACIADTVRQRLQNYITDYRTKKARHDMEYYEKLTSQALKEYNQSVGQYSSYQDSHMNTVLEGVKSNARKLERSTEIKYSAYNALVTQLQIAKAKLQERTPAFTIIQPAIVPLKPKGPKRMIFVLVCTFLAFAGTSFHILRDITK